MRIDSKTLQYDWQDNWGALNSTESSSHHDMIIDSQGRIYGSFGTEPYLRVFDSDGRLQNSFNLSGPTMHCLFISKDDEGEWLWNVEMRKQELSKCTLDGKIVKTIGRDAFGVKDDEKFQFTAGTYDPDTGNIWVTDGYGCWAKGESGGCYVYCFNSDLELQFRFDGSEAPCGKFNEPHWIFADRRKGRTEIYIADRSNDRIVVYSPEGQYLRTIEDGLITPSGFGSFDDKLVVVELKARLHILDADDRIIETLCDGREYVDKQGWPNRRILDTAVSPLSDVQPGRFNSPHGLAVDKDGNIYVHEWHKGVRVTKLCHVE